MRSRCTAGAYVTGDETSSTVDRQLLPGLALGALDARLVALAAASDAPDTQPGTVAELDGAGDRR